MGPGHRVPLDGMHYVMDEAQAFRSRSVPQLTIPDRNYYREYLERRGNLTEANDWLSLGPFSINQLYNLERAMPHSH